MGKSKINIRLINPQLISLLNRRSLNKLPAKPPYSLLPGTYVSAIIKNFDKIPDDFPENILYLQCPHCHQKDKYNVGTIIYNPIKYNNLFQEKKLLCGNGQAPQVDWLDCIQSTAYFRCHNCNGAGSWIFTKEARQSVETGIILDRFKLIRFKKLRKYIKGHLEIGCREIVPQWNTDIEEFFLNQLSAKPKDAYIWGRLGNSYYNGGRPELAVAAYERSIQHDREQLESLYSLGMILAWVDEPEESMKHLRQVLIAANRNSQLPVLVLSELLIATLTLMKNICKDNNTFLSYLPDHEEIDTKWFDSSVDIKNAKAVVSRFNFRHLNSNQFLAEVYMGSRRRELPQGEQVYQKYKDKFYS